ncbi:diguanylate cyclase domain-containing protein [Blastochloris tepida]|uniref:diguanylate cyclase domain-containing protein n=1 Tax=Blastochloris tepida TaxID=2233851 RepID=UPI0018D585ED|nr:diguanylate cyclase [Blastochloris tepida]
MLSAEDHGDAVTARRLLAELYERYRDQKRLLDRLVRISDRYQLAERERGAAYASDYRREVRRIEKLVRISDSYQAMLRELTDRLRTLSTHDDLTGLLNRRSLREQLLEAIAGASAFGVAFVDVDHFKAINDRWGHLAGDTVLGRLAEAIVAHLGHGDSCGRWGGEEFLILLRGRPAATMMQIAERLREDVANLRHAGGDGATFSVTISLGLTVHRPGEALEALLSRADSALYQAKETGRNRSVLLPADEERGATLDHRCA